MKYVSKKSFLQIVFYSKSIDYLLINEVNQNKFYTCIQYLSEQQGQIDTEIIS